MTIFAFRHISAACESWYVSLFLFSYISFRCKVYSLILWHLYTLQIDHHLKSSYRPSPERWPPSLVSPIPQPLFLLVTTNLISVTLSLFLFYFGFLFIFVDSAYEWNQSFSVWLMSLSIIPSRVIHVVADGRISSVYGWVVVHSTFSLSMHFCWWT